MKALVVYHSKTGITKKFGNEINNFLKEKKYTSEVMRIEEVKPNDIGGADIVFLGCWTSGLFLFLQHPDSVWKKYASQLPEMKNKKVGFFTTYKVATGSMFKNMNKVIGQKLIVPVNFILKSKDGSLSDENKKMLNDFLV